MKINAEYALSTHHTDIKEDTSHINYPLQLIYLHIDESQRK